MPDPTPGSAPAPAPEKPLKPIKAPLPSGVTREMLLSIFTGACFVLVGLSSSLMSGNPKPVKFLLIATGVALVLTAFGGQATVRMKSAIFAGATAAMLAILWLLNYIDTGDTERQFVSGQITNIAWSKYNPLIKLDATYAPSYHDRQDNSLRFVAFENAMNTAEATLLLQPRDGSEAPPIQIPMDCFRAGAGGTHGIDWQFDDANLAILDKFRERKPIGGLPLATGLAPCAKAEQATISDKLWGLLGIEANAQNILKNLPLDPNIRERALKELGSADSDIRRTARDLLSKGAPADVQAMLRTLDEDNSYRTRLGVTVALTEMLRQNKDLRDTVAAQFAPQHDRMLVAFAGDPDRTLSVYATEFLFDVADPDMALLALQSAASSGDANARYNWVFAARDGWARMSPDLKAAAQPAIDSLRAAAQDQPKTMQLLDFYR